MPEIQEVRVPDIGDVDNVTVAEILVSPGDAVAVDDSLIALESDKASMEVPATRAGTVREVKVKVGDEVRADDVILILEVAAAEEPPGDDEVAAEEPPGDDEVAAEEPPGDEPAAEPAPAGTAVAAPPSKPEPAPPAASPAPPPAAATAKVDEVGFRMAHASPSVRRLSRELGVDLGKVRGSGRKGRILKDDVRGFVKSALAEGGQRSAAGGLALPEMPEIDFAKFGEIEVRPLARIRKLSARNVHRSWLHVPHVTQHEEADVTEMEAFRKAHAEEAKAKGFKLTPVTFLLKAVAGALAAFPEVNASLDASGENLILKKYFHIGVAVDTPKGLVVPVVRDVDRKGLFELAEELLDTSSRARDGKLNPADFQGAGFTISSLGGIGGTAFTPIVNAPEVAILGVSRSRMKPVWQGGEFVPRLMLPLSLSYDHRVIDGAAAARFVVHLSALLGDLRRLLL